MPAHAYQSLGSPRVFIETCLPSSITHWTRNIATCNPPRIYNETSLHCQLGCLLRLLRLQRPRIARKFSITRQRPQADTRCGRLPSEPASALCTPLYTASEPGRGRSAADIECSRPRPRRPPSLASRTERSRTRGSRQRISYLLLLGKRKRPRPRQRPTSSCSSPLQDNHLHAARSLAAALLAATPVSAPRRNW
jgi:hypothetical protein